MSSGEKDPALDAINVSLPVDKRLWNEDIDGSVAHVRMLGACGILAPEEAEAIRQGLEQVRGEIAASVFPFREELEDIHMNVEKRLTELIGPLGGKLHTGRSRNDQVATDLRLWLRRELKSLEGEINELARALLDAAERELEAGTVLPLYTHLQRAQPVLLAHHLHAYVEMLERDRLRLRAAAAGMNELPLGAAAGAGSAWPVDPQHVADSLGFLRPCRNSIDAVASRDFALEAMAAFTILLTNGSRLAEELVLWSTREFGFVRLSQKVTTGSSIMPQKRNPDAAELVRAKAGRVLGRFVGLASAMRALPLAYNKDLQEDKEALFDACDQTRLCLRALTACVREATFDRQAMKAAVEDAASYALATELADYLTRKGIAFREAHAAVRGLVDLARGRGNAPLDQLPFEAYLKVSSAFEPDVYACLKLDAALARRAAAGGTAPERVKEALAASRARWSA